MKSVDENKICFIACVNDESFYEESVYYLNQLVIPEGMTVELLAVRGASSMASGYQKAMESSDAKYKIYIHQDIFVLNKMTLCTLIDMFRKNPSVGMAGLVGAGELSKERPIWWESSSRCGKGYNRKSMEEIQLDVFGVFSGEFMPVQAIDGIFMATQYDVPWRSDLFREWHFYDISQSFEFVRHGYKVVVMQQQDAWVIHFANRKSADESYISNMEIFKSCYMD